MRITLITPAAPQSRAGNRTTAVRWARLLRDLGHRIAIVTSDAAAGGDLPAADAAIALHAWRSADAITALADQQPACRLIVALTGTDIYRFQHSHGEITRARMEQAHALIGLHDRVSEDIPAHLAPRLSVVHQSARPLPPGYPGPPRNRFRVLVAGHLRDEKDALRAACATRALPAESRIRAIHAGRAYNHEWANAAREEATNNARFQWCGELPHWRVRRLMAGVHAMVMSSLMEGGANVVSEACVAGLPVIASDIAGNRGLLGDDYPGFYRAGDTDALRVLLTRVETDATFLARLRRWCTALAPRFTPAAERDDLGRALARAFTD